LEIDVRYDIACPFTTLYAARDKRYPRLIFRRYRPNNEVSRVVPRGHVKIDEMSLAALS
jgi:hypothetical protein